ALDVFTKLNYPTEKVTLLLNTTVEQGGLARKDIEMTLHRPITQVLPYAGDLYLSALNRGVPPALELATKPLGGILERWAFQLSAESQRAKPPVVPTPAWLRVAQAMQPRKGR
ncbi:MAG: response regulator receiver protein, partial [Oscillochloris sp.]|nr:response regulator receiver protein [Oscillochloris sp.]